MARFKHAAAALAYRLLQSTVKSRLVSSQSLDAVTPVLLLCIQRKSQRQRKSTGRHPTDRRLGGSESSMHPGTTVHACPFMSSSCYVSSGVQVGQYTPDTVGGGFLVRVSITKWVPDALISVNFAPCSVKCEDEVGRGVLITSFPTGCSFRLNHGLRSGDKGVLSFRVAAHAVAHCATLAGVAECPQLAPLPPPCRPPPSRPPPPSPLWPHPPPAPPLVSWLDEWLRHQNSMAMQAQTGVYGPVSAAWPACPLQPVATYERGSGRVHVRVSAWKVGTIILVHHDPTQPKCELWLDLTKDHRLTASGSSMLPSNVQVEHAQVVGQSIVGQTSPGGLLAFRLLDRPERSAFTYRVFHADEVRS